MYDERSPVGKRPVGKEYDISCAYGVKGDSWRKGYHPGVDFRCKDVPVAAYQDGKVVAAFDNDPNWGSYIKVGHPTGFYSYYCHLSRVFVGAGEKVERGHPIAVSGNSGVNRKTGLPHPYHLHFETRLVSTKEDVEPLFYTEEANG